MLHIVLGDVGSGKTTFCLQDIAACVAEGKQGIFLVPEQETVGLETLCTKSLPPEAALCFEVSNFTRLSNRVFRERGGLSRPYATPATKALLMHRTLRELSPFLHQKPERFDSGIIMQKLDGVRALHFAAATTDDLKVASQKTTDSHLKDKLDDLALISSFYEAALEETYADSETDLDRLHQLLQDNNCFRGYHIWIDSFHSFTRQQYRIISRFLSDCELTITLSLPPNAEQSICFAELIDTHRQLLKMADEMGVFVKTTYLGENKRQKQPLLRHIAKHLWLPNYRQITPLQEECGGVSILEGKDPYDAAEYVAADILRQVQAGAMYGDFAIIAADATKYSGILDSALTRAGIPCFLSSKANIASYEPIKFICAAYAAVWGGYKRDDVMAYLKCGLSNIPSDKVDAFELYTEAWDISGHAFVDGRKWEMHPNGYQKTETPISEATLEDVWEVKQALTSQLSCLKSKDNAPMTVSLHCQQLMSFLVGAQTEQKLREKERWLASCGELAISADYGRLWGLICDALDKLYETLGQDEITGELFCELLKLTFATSDIGHIPPARDEVTIGSASTLRTSSIKHFYLFGVCDGEFPPPAEKSRQFSEAECEALSAMGLYFQPSAEIRLQKELFYFYRAISTPTESVTLLTFTCDSGRAECRPSSALLRVKWLGGSHVRELQTATLPQDSFLYHPDAALFRLSTLGHSTVGEALRRWYKNQAQYATFGQMATASLLCDHVRVSEETCQTIWQKEMPLSQSRIESFIRCPFAYHQQYVLQLKENGPVSFSYSEIGTFVHYLLEHFLREHRVEATLSDEELRKLTQQAVRSYIADITPKGYVHDSRMQHIFSRLCDSTILILRELSKEFAHSDFRPVLFELPIGFDGEVALDAPRIPLPDGREVKLRGFIDRVDAYVEDGKVYVRVVDYKTGKKVFSEEDLAQGINLQLILYLSALMQADGHIKEALGGSADSEILPAGVLYFNCQSEAKPFHAPISPDEMSETVQKGMKRSGLFLYDMALLEHIEPGLEGRFTPIKKSKGELAEASKRITKTLEGWQALFDQVKDTIATVAKDMLSGRADAKPLCQKNTSVCNYCAYKPQCRNATVTKF